MNGVPSSERLPPERLPSERVLTLADEKATRALGAALARLAAPGDVIALVGDLGSGKTSLARGFIRARGRGDEEVPSPTFTLVETYAPDPAAQTAGGAAVWHFDLYRLKSPDEAWELGLEEALAGGIALIEWPDRLGPLLPAERLVVTLEPGPTAGARRARLQASPGWRARLAALAPARSEAGSDG